MIDNLSTLVEVSNFLGKRVAYIQGGGGNTSLKISRDHMLIKASGKFLSDVTIQDGFVPVDWEMLKSEICKCVTEAEYGLLLKKSIKSDDTFLRPSIETGFHAILNNCTLHSHSVWANILTCSNEGYSIVQKLFPNAIWVPYFTPGLALTKAILERVKNQKSVTIFLQNHGIVTSNKDIKSALDMHETITNVICKEYPMLIDFDETSDKLNTTDVKGLLFPDQAVYHSSPELKNSRAGLETMRAYEFLLDRITNAGLTPCYIDEAERDILVNMESEKFRQELVDL
ncbi:class II aldolase/adducin family protein [Amylibacter sp.]|nr:class II aldolase/adducin family protein [Amylibacter sp.]MDB4095670.1 class II aldolase/adducin family protein [Amylibacter sp.]